MVYVKTLSPSGSGWAVMLTSNIMASSPTIRAAARSPDQASTLLVKLGALAVVLLLTPQFAVDLQLTGSIGGPSSLAPSLGWPPASSCSTRFQASGPAA